MFLELKRRAVLKAVLKYIQLFLVQFTLMPDFFHIGVFLINCVLSLETQIVFWCIGLIAFISRK